MKKERKNIFHAVFAEILQTNITEKPTIHRDFWNFLELFVSRETRGQSQNVSRETYVFLAIFTALRTVSRETLVFLFFAYFWVEFEVFEMWFCGLILCCYKEWTGVEMTLFPVKLAKLHALVPRSNHYDKRLHDFSALPFNCSLSPVIVYGKDNRLRVRYDWNLNNEY